jgi:hypothetical protein
VVTSNLSSRDGFAARECDSDVTFFGQRFIGGDDEARPPQETA